MSDGDYVVKVWEDIFEDIFRDNQLLIKWGETFSAYSTDIENIDNDNDNGGRKKIGNKVDFRVVMKRYDIDLLNGEITSNTTGAKYSHANRKILRETKNISDQFYRLQFLSNSRKNGD